MIATKDLEEARARVASHLAPTPVLFSQTLSKESGARVYLKLESFQRTGSFKERGAINRLLTLTPAQKEKGVVTASAGNHAQAVAYHATGLGLSSRIFMPNTTPLLKVTRTKAFGAEVVIAGENYDEAHEAASAFAKESGAFYVHAYDDEQVIAGQATAGFELFDQLPTVDVIVVPVGGGGFVSGIALANEHLKKNARIVGVETDVLPSMITAMREGKPVQLPPQPTLADGIRVRRVGQYTLAICQRLVKEWATVGDNDVALAILHLMEQEKLVAEGAGAAGVAALLSGKLKEIAGKTICLMIGGGNIDMTLLSRILERGLVETGRMVKLALSIHDRPGELGVLLKMIGECEANVVEVHHERAFAESDWNDVEVDLVLETKGQAHIDDILMRMKTKGYSVTKVDNTGTEKWQRPRHP